MHNWKSLSLVLLLAGCTSTCSHYADVPPNDIGMILAPSGYEDRVYPPGQVDIGDVDSNRRGNSLVLIQRSGVEVKECFLARGDCDGTEKTDSEDHRCLVGPSKQPMTLDVRLVLALPNYETPQGKKDLARLFQLGNPRPLSGQDRVLLLTARSVYTDQAQLQVRGKIRQICAQYADFDTAFTAFADEGPDGLSRKIETAVAQALADNNVPLRLVNAVVSNMKPDQSVLDAIAAKQAATKRVEAIQVVTDFLTKNPDGTALDKDSSDARKLVYRMQVIQEIIAKGDEKGHSTIYMTDVSGNQIVPLPTRQ